MNHCVNNVYQAVALVTQVGHPSISTTPTVHGSRLCSGLPGLMLMLHSCVYDMPEEQTSFAAAVCQT